MMWWCWMVPWYIEYINLCSRKYLWQGHISEPYDVTQFFLRSFCAEGNHVLYIVPRYIESLVWSVFTCILATAVLYVTGVIYYNDVTMNSLASQITSFTIVYSTVNSRADQRNIKAPRHWPLYGEFTRTGGFPAQGASNAENVSIWWRHHDWNISSHGKTRAGLTVKPLI